MNSSELFFERPFLLLLIIPALALVIVPFLILPKNRRDTKAKIVSVILHCVAAVILVVILSGVGLANVTNEQNAVILIDLSDSTSGVQNLLIDEGQRFFDKIKEEMPTCVVAFGREQAVELSFGEDGRITGKEVVSSATDIGSALEYAASILPDDRAKRIVLFSDGAETDGDAADAARKLQSRGVRVDTVCFSVDDLFENEMQVSSLTGPEFAPIDERARLTVRVDSVSEGEAKLWLTDNNTFVNTITVNVQPGSNYYEMNVIPRSEGPHLYSVRLGSDLDTRTENNTASFCVNVEGGPRVLVLSPSFSDGNHIKNLLKKTASVDHLLAYSAPKTIVDLCKYDQVVLVNLEASDLPFGYDKLLSDFVKVYGRSLWTVGGMQSLSLGGMTDTGYEDLLPVSLDYNKAETDKDVALMLVLDCSRSMSSSGSPNLSLAKQSAIRCVEAMSEKDSVGIISFGGTAEVEMGLTLATNDAKLELTRAISKIQTKSGTNYCPALSLAWEELKNSRAEVRHVIFLSDGQPSDAGYVPISRKMYETGITISTIGLGYSVYSLPEISSVAYGRHYTVYDAEDLPEIMLSEAQMVAAGTLMTGTFEVQIPRVTSVTNGVDEGLLPTINAYIGTTLKEGAELCLSVGTGDPLYARMDLGKGKVAVFTSDIGGEWTDDWLYLELCDRLFQRMSSTIIDPNGKKSSILLNVEQRGQTALLRMETAADIERGSAEVEVRFGENVENAKFVQTGKGVYETVVKTEAPGAYDLKITLYDENGEMLDFDNSVHSVSYFSEYDAFAVGGEALLYDIADLTGGESVVYGEEKEIPVNAEMGSVRYTHSFLIPLAIIAALVYLAGLIVRYVRLKDVKRFFARFKKEKDPSR